MNIRSFASRAIAMLAVALFYSVATAVFVPGTARAELTTNIDDRVEVRFSRVWYDWRNRVFKAKVKVINVSTTDILPPVRLVVTEFKDDRFSLADPDGLTPTAQPYIDIDLAGDVLGPGESSLRTLITFNKERRRRDDDDSDDDDSSDDDSSDDDSDDDDRHWSKSRFDQSWHRNERSQWRKRWDHHRFPIKFDYNVLGGTAVAPQAPTSFPYALSPPDGVVPVVFNVGVLSEGIGVDSVFLRNLAEPGPGTLMNDAGADGDQVAGDDIYSTTLQVDGGALSPGQCLSYVGVTSAGGEETVSEVYELCATSFSTRVAESNLDPSNVVTLDDGNVVLADEVLIIFNRGTSEAAITSLVNSIDAEVVGTILLLRQYQVRLNTPLTPVQMDQLVAQLNDNSIVSSAAPNGLIDASAVANDTEFVNQRGLKATHVDDGWDTGATGAGITVIVLDEGVDAAHLDFGVGTVVAGGANTDATGHGTQMAGIIAAEADNMLGVAGIAHDARIRSVFVNLATDADFNQGFIDASTVAGSIVNVSLNRISPAGHVPGLCRSINIAINGMTGKVVVNSAGNNNSDGAWWPGRCNSASSDTTRINSFGADPTDIVVNKSRFIVVSATSCNADECAPDTRLGTSNFGAWVDVAAPGNAVPTLQTTSLGGSTTTITGTSGAAAIVSAAAANLRGCGVGLNDVQTALLAGSLVQIPYSGTSPGSTPRVNMVAALGSVNVAPTGVGPGNFAIDENTDTSGGTSLGTLSTIDGNTCDLHAYTIGAGGDAANFSIGGSGNDELILTAGTLNFEARSSYTVTVESTDYFGAGPASRSITVDVNDLNEPPTILPQERNIDENTANGIAVGAPIVASDPDAGATWTFAIVDGNTGGAFAIDPVTGQITVANSAALDFETNPVFNLSVEVTDNGSLTDATTITVILNDVLEATPDPVVQLVSPSSHPPIPAGQKVTCLATPFGTPVSSNTCPIVVYNGITYWAYSYIDNRLSMNIVGYDQNDNIVQQTNRDGIRYIVTIVVDTDNQVVTFTGQETFSQPSGATTTMTYSESEPLLIP